MTETRIHADSIVAPEDLPARLDTLLARWLVGGDAPPADALGDEADAQADELAVLAIAGQCRQFLLAPRLPADARSGPVWPAPTLPTLPEALRLRFRRAMKAMYAPQQKALLRMLSARGWMAHPFDWRAGHGDDDLPAAYDGWRRRAEVLQAAPSRTNDDALEDATPSERRRLLSALRAKDVAAARERIAALLPNLPAEQRLGLLDVLAEGLCADDLPLLEGLSSDRSERVRHAAARLRARLGATQILSDEDRIELRAWFDVGSSGLLKRTPKVTLTALKTKPQHAARRERLQRLGWSDLCELLGMDATALVNAWAPGDEDDDVLLECAAHSAPAGVLPALVERLLFERAVYARRQSVVHTALPAALARLDADARQRLLGECFARASAIGSVYELLDLAQAPLATLDLRALQRSPFWDAYAKGLRAHVEHGGGASAFAQECASLACLLAPATAQAVLRHALEAGVHAGDPALDALTLSAELMPVAGAHAT